MKISLQHVGWVTNNLELFEKFWVDILGFKRVWESRLPVELTQKLFGLSYGAICRRYELENITIEVHKFDEFIEEKKSPFNQFGINHICLLVENRIEFLKKYNFDSYIYNNPAGHQNIFIRDMEKNWIELRENLGKIK